ncbi:heme A synthase [Aggregicoccus sp. 17bor-14]|uniref:COX15/CtaA family protein n=1 Tax=Myxococcaceae TaxID=31 RepID=UPI00129C676A|nr:MULTISPECIES: COX15/CtaA family protein [Myxococcaceae]MBF5043443.1 COX15/CtaA family protein [Simulacricoccus sp. 17bor-14]MRI89201.1 heme A synthase [Aggregicoccus sp. 17bor-14]
MSPAPSPRAFRALAWGVLAFSLAVVLWGAFVRATGSGAGCGDHWPVCNGQVLPRTPTVATLIEYTHRLTSALVGLGAVALFVWGRRAHPRGHPVRLGVALGLALMLLEGALGAGLVKLQLVAQNPSAMRAFAMSAHLVNTFLLLAAQALTCVWGAGGRERPRLRGQGPAGPLVLLCAGGMLVLGVSGAIAALGDTLFPASSLAHGFAQDLDPGAHFLLRLRALHPLLAVLVGAGVVGAAALVARARPHSPEVQRAARTLGLLYALQLAAGVVNLVLLAPVAMQLVHLLLADLVWISLVRLGALALAAPAPAPLPTEQRPVAA